MTTAALDVATGFVIVECYKRHRAREFLDLPKQIDRLSSPRRQKTLEPGSDDTAA